MEYEKHQEPHWSDDLAEELGAGACARFLRRAAGMHIYIPNRARLDASVLRGLAGDAVASWLCDRYAGEYIDVPSARARARDTLRQAVLSEPGAPVNELAHRHGVTARRIMQIRAEGPLDDDEPPLLRLARNPSSE